MDKERLRRWFIPNRAKPPKPVASGLYHYQRESDGTYTRFHLRVEPDGQGMLLANATSAARLSPTGVMMAKALLDGRSPDSVLHTIKAGYKGADTDTIQADVARVSGLLNTLSAPGDNYPIINFDEIQIDVFQSQLMAPLEANIPLAEPEMLVPILDKLWDIGIPHVTILMPENPNAEHVIRAIERAEDLGLIAGVRGRATDLMQENLIQDLAMAGVDHITVLYASANADTHDALVGTGDHALMPDLYPTIQENEISAVAEIPLVASTFETLRETIDTLMAAGIYNYSFFAIVAPDEMEENERDGALPAQAMPQTAGWVEEIAQSADVRFLWQPPIQRDPRLSLAEQVQQGPRCTGDAAVRIEPNGDVIPPRGAYLVAGNVLRDEWQTIWQHEAFKRYRERVTAPTHCLDCPGLVICEADCPREQSGWAQGVGGAL
ncbi:MAG: SPASM domain-containing protein [Anaerolineae bacterium]|nr:SPASM domain-containing protein [Anaerolineae bacterium]